MSQGQSLNDIYEEWLDKSNREGFIKHYSEDNIIMNDKPIVIGHGGFGIVYKAKIKHSGKLIAMKALLLNRHRDEELYKDFVKELRTHKQVDDHPNIIRFLGISDLSGRYYMVFEYADGGTLHDHLQKHFPELTWNDKYRLALGITDGLLYLHSLEIIHKDLSSRNILIQDGVTKITDFGLSSALKQTKSTSVSRCEGDMAYIDPLSLKEETCKRGKQSDIFSLGVILWEISSGKTPCEGITKIKEIFLYRLRGSRDLPIPGTSEWYIDLYSKCWDEDPNERPSIQTVNKLLKSFIAQLPNYTLDLSDCQIGNEEVTVLAKAVELNFSVYSLYLICNKLTHARAITALEKTLTKFLSVMSLNLQSNQIGDIGATALAEALESNISLISLNLQSNQIRDSGVKALAKALKSNSFLAFLNLQNNQIKDAGAAALAEVLESKNFLTNLNLQYNQIGDTGAMTLAKALKLNSTLTLLNLQGNQIRHAGATALAKALKLNSTLTFLNLQSNLIGITGATALAKALKQNRKSSLTCLNLYGNQIKDAGAVALATALESNSSLKSLHLEWYQIIGDTGAMALAKALKSNSSLTSLHLDWNQIGDAGATALAEALESNSSLTSLHLDWNQIGDTGATDLAKALKLNSSLMSLHLDWNQIGDAGATALAEALESNSSLTSLHLRQNNIGNIGAEALVTALKSKISLKYLNLEWNYYYIESTEATALARALELNFQKSLHLD